MKTEFKSVVKDNIATAAVLASTVIAMVGAVIDSTDARADRAAALQPVQQMETIVITAPRNETVKLETILVTAARGARVLPASN